MIHWLLTNWHWIIVLYVALLGSLTVAALIEDHKEIR